MTGVPDAPRLEWDLHGTFVGEGPVHLRAVPSRLDVPHNCRVSGLVTVSKRFGSDVCGSYICNRCERVVPWCFGCADDMPGICDDCWGSYNPNKLEDERKDMNDLTEEEKRRRDLQGEINANPKTREQLEEIFGKNNVWDTDQLRAEFDVQGFAAPFCIITRKGDGQKGALCFQHHPRLYFDFREV